ncbi:MAG: sulfatase-like hydrolase/transferase, partial [Planctomycetes bacterium]|nr:sulfatase-like hydrolase/transferase [Planctomycetota bacterium]
SRHGAVCAPSRAMLMSGRTLTRAPDDLNGCKTLPEYLREAGYATFMAGKWHNGDAALTRAFPDARAVFRGGMCDHFQVPLCDVVDGEIVHRRRPAGHSTEHFCEATIDFLRRHARNGGERPFFSYLPLTAPHDPRDPPRRWLERLAEQPGPELPANFRGQHGLNLGRMTMTVRDENLMGWPRDPALLREQLREYRALVAHLDEQVGRVLATLDELGLRERTLVVFTADHGLALGSHGLLGKQSLYEHSMRAPCILSGPGVPIAERDGPAYLFDLTATVLETAGAAPAGIDGRSLWPMVRGEAGGRDELVLLYARTQRAIRVGDHKLIRYPRIDRTVLYDLARDPDELTDLADEPAHAERRRQLEARLRASLAALGDDLAWRAERLDPVEIDLTGKRWPADRWQPEWIWRKYWR